MIDYQNSDFFLKDGIRKDFLITYDGGEIDNSMLHSESFALTESLCSENELKFGGCEAGMIEFKIVNTLNFLEMMKGKELTVSIVLNEDYNNPFLLGTYKVDSDKLTSDRRHRNIVAYDAMYTLNNTEVSTWYNGLIFPKTLKDIRDSLFEYLGFEQKEITLPNDDAVIYSTSAYDELFAGELLLDICEVNGCFGRISRDNKFEYVFIEADTEAYEISKKMHNNTAEFDDYATTQINGIYFSQTNADMKINLYSDSTSNNMYEFTSRVLNFGEKAEPINTIAKNMYNKIAVVSFVPFSMGAIGNPCVECGDRISFYSGDYAVNTVIFERKLTGIQSLSDSYSAEGTTTYEKQNTSDGVESYINGLKQSVERNTFYSYSYTNAEEISVSDEWVDVIQFNVAATANTDVIFIATIPFTLFEYNDVWVRYTIDNVPQSKILYFPTTPPDDVITITQHFPVDENSRFVLGVQLKVAFSYYQRRVQAQINALKTYIETGVYQENIDSSIYSMFIDVNQISATIFSRGLANLASWDGTITIAETLETPIVITSSTKMYVGDGGGDIEDLEINKATATEELSTIKIGTINVTSLSGNVGSSVKLENYNLNADLIPIGATYADKYISIDSGTFCLRTEYSFASVSATVDSGTMSTITINNSDSNLTVSGVVFE